MFTLVLDRLRDSRRSGSSRVHWLGGSGGGGHGAREERDKSSTLLFMRGASSASICTRRNGREKSGRAGTQRINVSCARDEKFTRCILAREGLNSGRLTVIWECQGGHAESPEGGDDR